MYERLVDLAAAGLLVNYELAAELIRLAGKTSDEFRRDLVTSIRAEIILRRHRALPAAEQTRC
jgi:hypothetical protein